MTLDRAQLYGAEGVQFHLAFPGIPRSRVVTYAQPQYQAQYGTAVEKAWIWTSHTHHVHVAVDVLAEVPPPKRLNPFLRSYLPTTHGGRIVQRFGLPAATETVPCATPSGSCGGTVSALVVLDTRTLYFVLVGASQASDAEVISSFRPA